MSDAGPDEHRRLLELIGLRIDAQVRNAHALAESLGVQLIADPVEPVRQDATLASGLTKTEAGLAVDIVSLPEARLRDGWLIIQGDTGGLRKLSVKTIVGGPYFPGSFGANTFYMYYGPQNHAGIAPLLGSGLAATKDQMWDLAGSNKAIWTALYYIDEAVQLFVKLLRTGASKATV